VTTIPPEHQDLIRRVLGANYLELSVTRLRVDEEPEVSTRVVVVVAERGGQQIEVDGTGGGVVEAMYHALLGRWAVEYQSLKSVRLSGFSVEADLDTRNGGDGVDAVGTVTIDVVNSEGRRFHFTDSSRSVTASIARAVVAVVQYFVNAERAFITLHNARRDAVERGRADLIQRYTAELAEVVECTSYAEVIESFKKELR
jgi:hypothetical protein